MQRVIRFLLFSVVLVAGTSPSPTSASPTTLSPTHAPTAPTTEAPTEPPTPEPTFAPTDDPTDAPTEAPTTTEPTPSPTSRSPTTHSPTHQPTTEQPTSQPTNATAQPTDAPTTKQPTNGPTAAPSSAPTGQPTPVNNNTAQPTAQPTPSLAPTSTQLKCVQGDRIEFSLTFSPCNASSNQTILANLETVIRTAIGAPAGLDINITSIAVSGSCGVHVILAHPTAANWPCRDYLPMLASSSIQTALVASDASLAGVNVTGGSVELFAGTPGPTPKPPEVLLNAYVIIVPSVIVFVVFVICAWMFCTRPKVKRQERPVFDGFEMGDAHQLEKSSHLEFAVPAVDDPKGSKRLTIN